MSKRKSKEHLLDVESEEPSEPVKLMSSRSIQKPKPRPRTGIFREQTAISEEVQKPIPKTRQQLEQQNQKELDQMEKFSIFQSQKGGVNVNKKDQIQVPNISSKGKPKAKPRSLGGHDNLAFIAENPENIDDPAAGGNAQPDKPPKSKSKKSSKNNNSLFAFDQESSDSEKIGEIIQMSADVHYFQDPDQNSVLSEVEEKDQKVEIGDTNGNETAIEIKNPTTNKIEPTTDTDTDADEEGSKKAKNSEEYLAITMPPASDSKDSKDFEKSPSPDTSTATSASTTSTKNKNKLKFMNKWKSSISKSLFSSKDKDKDKDKDKVKKSSKDSKDLVEKTEPEQVPVPAPVQDTKIDIENESSSSSNSEESDSSDSSTGESVEKPSKLNKNADFDKNPSSNKGKDKDTVIEMEVLKNKTDSSSSSSSSSSSTTTSAEESEIEDKKSEKSSSIYIPKSVQHVQHTGHAGQNQKKEKLLSINIIGGENLPRDPYIIHPLVKVTIMDQSGTFIKSQDLTKITKNVRNRSRSGGNLRTTDKLSEAVQPLMTQKSSIPSFSPVWNELLVFDQNFENFCSISAGASNVIFLFEIMDFLRMSEKGSNISGFHGSEEGWYKIAWGFLKPIGANDILNLGKKLKLQLYKPQIIRSRDRNKFKDVPEVFIWWSNGKRVKLPSTLTIEVKGIQTPKISPEPVKISNLISMGQKELNQTLLESQLPPKISKKDKKDKSKVRNGEKSTTPVVPSQIWRRISGQKCKLPNEIYLNLPTSKIPSLNLTICGNVQCLKFSPNGERLACGLNTEDLHVVLVFEFPSGGLLCTLKGHYDLIYDLDWIQINSQNLLLASASGDSTSMVWKICMNIPKPILIKTLLHPAFVYCVKFYPKNPSIVINGCFDHLIRFWTIDLNFKDQRSSSTINEIDYMYPYYSDDSKPILILDNHTSFVNCLAFTPNCDILFSGDGSGFVLKWDLRQFLKKKICNLISSVNFSDIGGIPVNSLSVHPGGHRILVHLRENRIKLVDIGSMLVLQTFPGLVNEKLQIRSCFSPCGSLVLSGSEDSTLCIWSESGSILQFITPSGHTNCHITSLDYHPFDYFLAIGLSSPIFEPSPVIIYTHLHGQQNSIDPDRPPEKLKKSRKLSALAQASIVGSRSFRSRTNSGKTTTRGGSSEKFQKIIKKLDTAMKVSANLNRNHQNFENLDFEQGTTGEPDKNKKDFIKIHEQIKPIATEKAKDSVRIKIIESTPPPEDSTKYVKNFDQSKFSEILENIGNDTITTGNSTKKVNLDEGEMDVLVISSKSSKISQENSSSISISVSDDKPSTISKSRLKRREKIQEISS